MELRFVERMEREPVNGSDLYRMKPVRILQFRTHDAPWWQDVPLEKETGTEPATGKAG